MNTNQQPQQTTITQINNIPMIPIKTEKTTINIGHIVIDVNTKEEYGVYVNNLNGSRLVFRLKQNIHPIFSKLNPNIILARKGHINDKEHLDLKLKLLEYYRNGSISDEEEEVLRPLLNIAYPNGIPLYNTSQLLTHEDIQQQDLATNIQVGKKILLYTTPNSSVSYLNGEIVYVIDKLHEGVWVARPSSSINESKFHFLFYNDNELSTFAGISKIEILSSDENNSTNVSNYIEKYKEYNKDNDLLTSINIKGKIYKINPTKKRVIVPMEMHNNIYVPLNDNIIEEDTNPMEIKEKLHTLQKQQMEYDSDSSDDYDYTNNNNNNNNKNNDNDSDSNNDSDVDIDTKQIGGSKKLSESLKKLDEEYKINNYMEYDIDNYTDKDNAKNVASIKTKSKSKMTDIYDDEYYNITSSSRKEIDPLASYKDDTIIDYTSDNESIMSDASDYSRMSIADEIDLDDEEDINVVEVVKKVERVDVPEEDKVYKEYLQIGEIYKIMLEQIPTFLRENVIVTNKVKKDVLNLINIKNSLIDSENNLIEKKEIKPLVNEYLNGKFTNNILIPIVVNSKKIYSSESSKSSVDTFDTNYHHIIEDFFTEVHNFNYLTDIKKRANNNYQTIINNIFNELKPYKNVASNDKGIFIELGSNIDNNDIDKLSLNTFVLRYCNEQFSCRSFESIIESIDYTVTLGPQPSFFNEKEKLGELSNKLHVYDNMKPIIDGEILHIIGFLRLPLNYNPDIDLIDELYENIDIKVLNYGKDDFQNFLYEPKKILLYKFIDASIDDYEHILNDIVPSLKEIINEHSDLFSQEGITQNLKHLKHYGYTYDNLNLSEYTYIIDHHKKYIKNIEESIDKLDKLVSDKNKQKPNNIIKNFNVIDDNLLDELEKIYLAKYHSRGDFIDSDINRLLWISNMEDNGQFLYHNQLYASLNVDDINNSIGQLETKLKASQTQLQILTSKGGNNTEIKDELIDSNGGNDMICKTKSKYRVVEYKSLPDLQNDNGKIIQDSNGDIIMVGDFAVTDIHGKKELFKRSIVNDTEIWVKQSQNILYQLMEQEKAACDEENKYDIKNDNSNCLYDIDNLTCRPVEDIIQDNELEELVLEIDSIKNELEYYKNLNKVKNVIESDFRRIRQFINDKVQAKKKYDKFMASNNKLKTQDIDEQIMIKRPCNHFTLLDYFRGISNLTLEEEYRFIKMILDKYQDNTQLEITNEEEGKQFTTCNVCNQALVCNHYLMGIENLKNDELIDMEAIVNNYGIQIEESYVCKICGETLMNTESKDIANFVKVAGKEGKRNFEREVMEGANEVDKNKLERFFESMEDDPDNKVGFYVLMKKLAGIDDQLLSSDEDIIMNFINSHNYKKREIFIQNVLKNPKIKPQLVKIIADIEYKKYIYCDIAAAFLIVLQASSKDYSIKNKFCKKNYYGYPIFKDIKDTSGINFILCLIRQIATGEDFKPILKNEEKIRPLFVNRLNVLLKENEYFVNLLNEALITKGNNIDNIIEFEEHYTNYWDSFKPRLHNLTIDWIPKKKLQGDEINNVNKQTIFNMLKVGKENADFYGLSLMKIINNIILNEDFMINTKSLGNTCCLESVFKKYKKENSGGDNSYYQEYFRNSDTDYIKIEKELATITELKHKLNTFLDANWYNILTAQLDKPSYPMLGVNFNATQEEIRSLYVKYIASGDNIGKPHIYNAYDVCILSGESKKEIEERDYNMKDYVNLMLAIRLNNTTKLLDENELESHSMINKNEKYTEEIFKYVINNFDDSKILNDILTKLLEQIGKETKEESYKMWSLLSTQLQKDIDYFSDKFTSDNVIGKFINGILTNLCDFVNLNEEQKELDNNLNTSNYKRYKKKEQELKKLFNLLINSVSSIKNKKYINVTSKTQIKPVMQGLVFEFIKDHKLFGLIYDKIKPHQIIINKIIGHKNNKHLSSEHSSMIIHYIFIQSLLSILLIYEDKELRGINMKINKTSDNEIVSVNKDKFIDFNKDNDYIDASQEDIILDGQEYMGNNLIDKIEKSRNINLNKINKFLYNFISYANTYQQLHDKLTLVEIKKIVAADKEKQQRKNLNVFRKLKFTEGLEDQYKLLLLQIKMKQIDYRSLNEKFKDEMEQLGIDVDNNKEYIEDDRGGGITDNMNPDQYTEERINNQLESDEIGYGDDDGNIDDDGYGDDNDDFY